MEMKFSHLEKFKEYNDTEIYPTIEEWAKVKKLIEVEIIKSKFQSELYKVYNLLLKEMMLCDYKFHSISFIILSEKFNLWVDWYNLLVKDINQVIKDDSVLDKEILISSMKYCHSTYSNNFINSNGEIAKKFVETHSKVFDFYLKEVETFSFTSENLPEFLSKVSNLLLFGLTCTGTEIIAIDTTLNSDKPIFFVPPHLFTENFPILKILQDSLNPKKIYLDFPVMDSILRVKTLDQLDKSKSEIILL